MITYVRKLVDERDHLTEMASSTAERAAAEDRDLNDTESASLKQWQERCAEIDAQLESHNVQLESSRHYATLRAAIAAPDNGDLTPARRNGGPAERATWGTTFVDSDAFRHYDGAGVSTRVAMPYGLLERAAADPITTTDMGGLVSPYRHEPPLPTWRRPLLDEINREPVGVGAVEYFYFQPPEPNAAPVVAEGAIKPPMDLTITEKTQSLVTYAHWKAITRQALEDYARIRAIIEGYLREGLLRAVEEAAAAAILADPNIPPGPGGANALAAIRAAIATVQANGFTPTTVLLNPADWATIDLSVMGSTLLGPNVSNGYWGLRVVASTNVPAGTAIVGDFRQGVTLFDRNVTNVFLSDSHTDFFLRNTLVILAETRALPAVTMPTALVKVTWTGGAAAPAGGGGGGD